MATVTLTSTCNTNLSQTLAYENNHTLLRDASFSSYLSSAEETFILKLTESSRNLSPAFTTPKEPPCPLILGRTKTEDGEISIFGAEKYFNGGMDEKPRIAEKSGRKHHYKKDEQVDLRQLKPKNRLGTPSASSEASWNSQSALLRSLVRNQSLIKQNKVHGKRFFTGFSCNCSCSDEKSVDINENVGENNSNKNLSCGGVHGKEATKEPIKLKRDLVNLIEIEQSQPKSWIKEEMNCKAGLGLNREECFTFPLLNSGLGNLTVNRQLEQVEKEKARKSLEVFSSPLLEKEDMDLNLERKLTMLTWNATPKLEGIPAISGSGGTYDDEDIESDTSSDLFEIESLSGNTHPFFTRQTSDGMSSCVTPTTWYEPSEASIEWSVITASAANFLTASDYGEQRVTSFMTKPEGKILTTMNTNTNTKTTMSKDVQRHRPSMLSGCRSYKAVKVAENVCKMSDNAKTNQQRCLRSDSITPMAKFQAEAKLTHFESAHTQHAFASRSSSRPYYARASQSLYMQ